MAINSTIIPAIFITWLLVISMPTIFAHWTQLKYLDFVTVAESITLSTMSIDQIQPYIGISLIVLALTTPGSALLIRRKELQ